MSLIVKEALHFRGPKFWKKNASTLQIFKPNCFEFSVFCMCSLVFIKARKMDTCKLIQIDSECKHVQTWQTVVQRSWKLQVDVSENSGTSKSSILIVVSIINHPFWGTPIFGNPQVLLIPTKKAPKSCPWISQLLNHQKLMRTPSIKITFHVNTDQAPINMAHSINKRIQSTNLSLVNFARWASLSLPFIPFLKKHKKHTTVVYTKSCFMRPTSKIDWFHPQKSTLFHHSFFIFASFPQGGGSTFQPTASPQVLPNAHRIHHRLSTSQWDRPWPLLKMVQVKLGWSPGVGRHGFQQWDLIRSS